MRVPRIRVIETMLVCSILALLVLTCITLTPLFVPPPLVFTAFEVVDFPPQIVAGTRRREASDCTNGIQAELRSDNDVVTRLPVPARSIEGNVSVYPLVIPDGVELGRHFVKVRETFLCPGRDPRVVESPWLPMEVGG